MNKVGSGYTLRAGQAFLVVYAIASRRANHVAFWPLGLAATMRKARTGFTGSLGKC